MTEGKTAYPSIDKPWLKYYSKEHINAKLPKCKVYDYVESENRNHASEVALDYYGKTISYGRFFEATKKAAKGFLHMGIKARDVVTIIAVITPEIVYSIYGLNRIGAISNLLDPRESTEEIRDSLLKTNSTAVVALDLDYEKITEAVKGTSVKSVVFVSPADSLPIGIKGLYKMKTGKIKIAKEYYSWKRFIQEGKVQELIESPYHENECCVIVETGGTTGETKRVMLTDDNLNQSAFQLYNSPFDLKRGDVIAGIIPPFVAYGIGNGMHMPLIYGMRLLLIPLFHPDKFDEFLLKHRPNHVVGVPAFFEGLVNSKKMDNQDISFLKSLVVGADALRPELEDKLNSFLKAHNAQNNVLKGYGLTEVTAAVSACMSDDVNKLRSVGIPFSHTVISIFDPDTGKELKIGEKGEVCTTGPNTMLGYYNDEAGTKQILKKHDDGLVWLHSGDIGYMDEDGFLYINGRIKRIIIRFEGKKVFPNIVENIIEKNDMVKECCVVGTKDPNHIQGMLPMLFVVLTEEALKDKERALAKLREFCDNELPDYSRPVDIRVLDRLPLTPIGKVDYRSLEKI